MDWDRGAVVQRLPDLNFANQVLPLSNGTSVNASAIGIEMHSNTDQETSAMPFTPAQLEATLQLTTELQNRYRIPRSGVVTHASS